VAREDQLSSTIRGSAFYCPLRASRAALANGPTREDRSDER